MELILCCYAVLVSYLVPLIFYLIYIRFQHLHLELETKKIEEEKKRKKQETQEMRNDILLRQSFPYAKQRIPAASIREVFTPNNYISPMSRAEKEAFDKIEFSKPDYVSTDTDPHHLPDTGEVYDDERT